MNELELRGYVGWQINDYVVRDFLKKSGGKDITVRVHTYGGSVFEGNLIYNSFKSYKGKKKLIIEGVCASMGAIFMGAFDEIEIVKNGFVMIHTPSGFTEGNAAAHESNAKLLRSMEKNFKEVLSKTAVDIEKVMDGNDHWFDAQDALDNKLVNKILDIEANISLDEEAQYKGLFKKQFDFLKANYSAQFNPVSAEPNSEPIINNKNQSTMKKILALLISFGMAINIEATEEQAIDAIKAKFKEKDDEIKRLNDLVAKQLEDSKKAVLDNAKASGRINDEQLKTLAEISANLPTVEDVTKLVNATATPVSVTQLIKNAEGGTNPKAQDRSNWDWDEYQKTPEGQKALEKLETEDSKKFQELYSAKYPD